MRKFNFGWINCVINVCYISIQTVLLFQIVYCYLIQMHTLGIPYKRAYFDRSLKICPKNDFLQLKPNGSPKKLMKFS